MFAYYLRLGLRSLRRNPVLTALMVMAIGFGVAASMTTYSVFRAVSGDPIPEKSSRLFAVQLDAWGPHQNVRGEPADLLGYVDAMALMRARPVRQTSLYGITLSVLAEGSRALPLAAKGYAIHGDFFPMFEVPFLYGSGWNANDDANRADVVVLSEEFNQKLFNGGNSVGRSISLDGHDYRVVGVARHWDPKPRFFALATSDGFEDPTDFYLPFNTALERQIQSNSNSCRGHLAFSGWDEWLHKSNCVWAGLWVELDSAADVARYREFLTNYAADQQRAGRFGWPPNVRLRNVQQWLDYEHVVPPETRISLMVSLGFFVICLVNTIGLLLAKFMRRAGEIGVRRALGASRREIYTQYLIEAGSVGLAGGVLGLLLTALGIAGVGLLFEQQIAQLARLDASLVSLTLLVAMIATLLAAFYPAWRAARVQPAWQLKSN